jgi:Flp pilus assembly protein TadG
MSRRSRLSKGQFLVLFTLVLPVLLGAVGLAADLGVVYFNWSVLQKAADAAALAGATYLTPNPIPTPAPPNAASGCPSFPGDYDTTAAPKSVGCTYATYNFAKASEVTVNPQPGATPPTVQVVLKRPNVPTYFLRFVGLTQLGVNAAATAIGPSAPNTITHGLFPVGLQCTTPCDLANLDPGQTTTFGSKFVGGLAPGNWDWVNVGQGTGASQLGSAIEYGSSGSYKVGDDISTSPGNKGNSGPVKNGLNARLSACAAVNSNPAKGTVTDPCANGGNTSAVPADDPCLVVVPAVDYHGCTGNCTMAIQGFAEIYLEQSSTGTQINGCFVQALDPNAVVGGGTAGASLGTLSQPVLIQ